MNRLANELSPYLQQHKNNPVDWYPWGDEAIQRAVAEDRPILVSIGYSACHWCHVMERESFENEAIAAKMNELFVNIKVDREERPDLDQIYQLVVQLTRRSGGWPLTVFLTPSLKPFFGGTYFPPEARHGMPGFPMVLDQLARAYRERRDEVEEGALEMTAAIADVLSQAGGGGDPSPTVVTEAARTLGRTIDETYGGFGRAPKFPNTMNLEVLLRAGFRYGESQHQGQVVRSLDAMRKGGIYDQLGGGFHRYSVDEAWRVPHFEKMLYDNALLTRLLVDAWQATGESRFAETVRETLAYVEREMTAPNGGFYSTQDADSEGEEGTFFVWKPNEFDAVLGEDDAKVMGLHFGVTTRGNFEHGATVLSLATDVPELAELLDLPEVEIAAIVRRSREKLFRARNDREKPFRDEKIIAAWNGLMASAFARAAFALKVPAYAEVARRALDMIEREMVRGSILYRIHKDGETRVEGFLDDYAEVAVARIDLYEATGEIEHLRTARRWVDQAIERFSDPNGGFFYGPPNQPHVIVRAKEDTDNAVPAGSSSMAHALLRLWAFFDDERYRLAAESILRSATPRVRTMPAGFGHLIGAMDRYVKGSVSVLVQGEELIDELRKAYVPNLSLTPWEFDRSPEFAPPIFQDHLPKDPRPTALLCESRSCRAPIYGATELRAALRPQLTP